MVFVQFAPDQRFHDGNPAQDYQLVQFVNSVEWAGLLESP